MAGRLVDGFVRCRVLASVRPSRLALLCWLFEVLQSQRSRVVLRIIVLLVLASFVR